MLAYQYGALPMGAGAKSFENRRELFKNWAKVAISSIRVAIIETVLSDPENCWIFEKLLWKLKDGLERLGYRALNIGPQSKEPKGGGLSPPPWTVQSLFTNEIWKSWFSSKGRSIETISLKLMNDLIGGYFNNQITRWQRVLWQNCEPIQCYSRFSESQKSNVCDFDTFRKLALQKRIKIHEGGFHCSLEAHLGYRVSKLHEDPLFSILRIFVFQKDGPGILCHASTLPQAGDFKDGWGKVRLVKQRGKQIETISYRGRGACLLTPYVPRPDLCCLQAFGKLLCWGRTGLRNVLHEFRVGTRL